MALIAHPAGAITSEIIGAAMEVHSHLGPGLLEVLTNPASSMSYDRVA